MTLTIGDLIQNLKKMSASSALRDDTPVYIETYWQDGSLILDEIVGTVMGEDNVEYDYCVIQSEKKQWHSHYPG